MLEQNYLLQLKNNVWYSQLPPEFQTYIVEHAKLLHFSKGQIIFQSGDIFDGIYAVIHGAVHLGYINIKGRESLVAIADPIMWFGEISLIDALPRSHNATAIEKSIVLKMNQKAIEQLVQQHPEFWFYIAKLTSQKLRYAFAEIISYQTLSFQQRLAQRLIFILNGYGNHLNIEHNTIHLSQEQLANMMVCSRQTINLELQQMEKLHILKVAFKKIEIIDLDQLKKLADPT